jgi:hypothetical protein
VFSAVTHARLAEKHPSDLSPVRPDAPRARYGTFSRRSRRGALEAADSGLQKPRYPAASRGDGGHRRQYIRYWATLETADGTAAPCDLEDIFCPSNRRGGSRTTSEVEV